MLKQNSIISWEKNLGIDLHRQSSHITVTLKKKTAQCEFRSFHKNKKLHGSKTLW